MKGLLLFAALAIAVMSGIADSDAEPEIAPPLEAVTCTEDGDDIAVKQAVYFINQHHDNGYKFQLTNNISNTVEDNEKDNCCVRKMHLELQETTCHVVSPTLPEDCELQPSHLKVTADCNVTMTVDNFVGTVTQFDCDTTPISPQEIVTLCPDCPAYLPLNNSKGVKSVKDAVTLYNRNKMTVPGQRLYRLLEVGKITTGYIPSLGMATYAKFVMVETHCPVAARIAPEACMPLCPDRAHYAICASSLMNPLPEPSVSSELNVTVEGMQLFLECDLQEPKNTTVLAPGEDEPMCDPPPQFGREALPGQLTDVFPNQEPQYCGGAVEPSTTVHPICSWKATEVTTSS